MRDGTSVPGEGGKWASATCAFLSFAVPPPRYLATLTIVVRLRAKIGAAENGVQLWRELA
jgi:hypothetical protein